MAAELLIAGVIATAVVGTRGGRQGARVFYAAAGGPDRKALAAGRDRVVEAAGTRTGNGVRRTGRVVGRAGKAVGTRAGDKALSRLERREAPAPLVWRTRSTDTPAAVEAAPEPDPVPSPSPVSSPVITPRPASSPVSPESTPVPPSATKESTVSVTELETPSSDGEFLANCTAMAEQAKALAQQMSEYTADLIRLGLPPSVTGYINMAGESAADMAGYLVTAGHRFEEEYEEVRTVAQRGMHFRGEDAA